MPTRDAMLTSLAVTGGVITSAGVVLAGTFAVLAVLPLIALTQLGVTVALGVLLDTLVVRSILVPALTFELGERTWWPARFKRGEQAARLNPGTKPRLRRGRRRGDDGHVAPALNHVSVDRDGPRSVAALLRRRARARAAADAELRLPRPLAAGGRLPAAPVRAPGRRRRPMPTSRSRSPSSCPSTGA